MDSKFIRTHQCSLERSHVALTEINSELRSRPSPSLTKTDSYRSISHKKLQKQNDEDFSIQLLYGWLYLSYIYRRNCCPTHILKLTHQTGFYLSIIPPRNISDKFTIIQDLCRFLQPGLISSTIFCKKLEFPTANHNRYIKLHWAQFPVIGNTYLELNRLKNPL